MKLRMVIPSSKNNMEGKQKQGNGVLQSVNGRFPLTAWRQGGEGNLHNFDFLQKQKTMVPDGVENGYRREPGCRCN